ncbi:unnamed protein product [Arctogadus glacialis]
MGPTTAFQKSPWEARSCGTVTKREAGWTGWSDDYPFSLPISWAPRSPQQGTPATHHPSAETMKCRSNNRSPEQCLSSGALTMEDGFLILTLTKPHDHTGPDFCDRASKWWTRSYRPSFIMPLVIVAR